MSAKRELGASCCCALLAMLALTAGCVSLKKSYPQKRYYLLHAARPGQAPPAADGAALKVRRFGVSPAFAGRELVYRTGELTYESDFYNQFFSTPGHLVTEGARRWLAASGLFGHVVDSASRLEARYVLEGMVVVLYGDYREKEAPRAVLGVQFLLLDDAPSAPEVVFQREYSAKQPLKGTSADALVEGWAQALRSVLEALERDLRQLDL